MVPLRNAQKQQPLACTMTIAQDPSQIQDIRTPGNQMIDKPDEKDGLVIWLKCIICSGNMANEEIVLEVHTLISLYLQRETKNKQDLLIDSCEDVITIEL